MTWSERTKNETVRERGNGPNKRETERARKLARRLKMQHKTEKVKIET